MRKHALSLAIVMILAAIPARAQEQLRSSDIAGLKAAVGQYVVVTGTVARVDRTPPDPGSQSFSLKIYFTDGGQVFASVGPDVAPDIERKFGRNGLVGQRMAFRVDRLDIPSDGPIELRIVHRAYIYVPVDAQPTSTQNAASRSIPSPSARSSGDAARIPGDRCDAAAAHPEDTGHSGDGIADDRIQSATAITECAAAVDGSPGTGRFHFQLGRAYWAGKRYEEALQAFLKAEELNHAPAYFYLGQAFEKGLIQGEKADPAAAREMYIIAASEGFPPAIRAFGGAAAEAVPATVADFGEFERPNFMRAVYQNTFGDLEAIWKRDTNEEGPWELAFYVQGIHDFLVLRPNEYDTTCPGLMEPEVSSALRNMVSGLKEPRVSGRGLDALLSVGLRNERMQSTREAGTDDVYALAADYGGCRGPVVRRVYGNLKGYLLTKSSAER